MPQPGDPQSLNRYSYTRNSPTKLVDPTGHAAQVPDDGGLPDPLTEAQRQLAAKYAALFGIPYELVAATIAVEIVDDTDWTDPILDFTLQTFPLALHYNLPGGDPARLMADAWLTGYEHYFGLLGSRGPGNGVANVHMQTAKDTEQYFAENYPDSDLLKPMPDHYCRSAATLSDAGNIYYTAAILRKNADYRTGAEGSHTSDLSDLDMQMIYGRFRCRCWNSWTEFRLDQTVPSDSRGYWLVPYLMVYR